MLRYIFFRVKKKAKPLDIHVGIKSTLKNVFNTCGGFGNFCDSSLKVESNIGKSIA